MSPYSGGYTFEGYGTVSQETRHDQTFTGVKLPGWTRRDDLRCSKRSNPRKPYQVKGG